MLTNGSHQIYYEKNLCPPELAADAITWARQAGQIAMGYFNNVSATYKDDNSCLTQADLEIETFLLQQIRATYPDHQFIGEEGGANQNNAPTSPYLWAIDPIDGTTAFVQGLPGWGISLGLMYNLQPIFGLFYMPLLDDLTYTNGSGIYCNSHHLSQTVQPDWGRKGFLAVTAGSHHDFDINVLRSRALGSIGANLVYTARGTATAALIPKAYLWDLVAGASILNRVGGELRYLSGKKVEYHQLFAGGLAPEPIIAGYPQLLDKLQNDIRPRKTA